MPAPFPLSRRTRLGITALFLLAPVSAWAAGGGSGASETIFLAQLLVLIVCGRLAGEAMERLGQPAVMGQLIAGILLGPSFFGLLLPELQHALFPANPVQKGMIDAVAQVGVLIILLLAGMETDLVLVNKVRRAALSVSVTGIALPFACGFALGELLPASMLADPDKRIVTSLFLGTALSISSVKIVAIVVRQMNFIRRNVGQVILASAIIDDTIGWLIISLTFSIAATGALELAPLLKSVAGAILFLGLSLTVGRRLVTDAIRLANDHFVGELPVVSVVLVIMAIMALITQALGLHTVLGAFVAGVLVGESPILTRKIEDQLRGLTTGLFMPVFFGLSGLGTDLTVLADPKLLAVSAGLVAIASLGKFSGAFAGGAMGGLSVRESLALGCGMNARGSTEVVVASIGLAMGALSQTLYTMIVVMAVVTTMAMPPTLRWALRRLPMRPEEKERLEREEFEATSFVASFERLLVLPGSGQPGGFAARLAGLLAGPLGLPVTTLGGAGEGARPDDLVRAAAEESRAVKPGADPARPVDVTARPVEGEVPRAVAEEARRGYDMLLAALTPAGAADSPFDDDLAATLDAFPGAVSLVRVSAAHAEDPLRGPRRIVVPLNGTPTSRRGLEVALLIARSSRAAVVALHVRERPGRSRWRRLSLGRRTETAILREASRLAEQFEVPLRTALLRRPQAAEAILAEAARADLVVMGVTRRPGAEPRFGTVPDALLSQADASVLLVAT